MRAGLCQRLCNVPQRASRESRECARRVRILPAPMRGLHHHLTHIKRRSRLWQTPSVPDRVWHDCLSLVAPSPGSPTRTILIPAGTPRSVHLFPRIDGFPVPSTDGARYSLADRVVSRVRPASTPPPHWLGSLKRSERDQ